MIGSTTGKEPDYIQDEDLRSPDQLRGDMKAINKAKMSLVEKATVQGVMKELEVMKQQREQTHEQLDRLIGMYGTLQNELNSFRQEWFKQLNVRVNGGSTTPEDYANND